MDDKVKLVEEHKDCHGLNRCLDAVGLARGTWYYRQRQSRRSDRDSTLKDEVLRIVREHPGYGYRRILPEVNNRLDAPVNHKRLRRVLREYELALPRCLPKHRPSPIREILKQCSGELDLVTGRNDLEPLEAFSTDITELHYAGGARKAYLMAFVDIESKLVPGWALARSGDRQLALDAWKAAKEGLRRLGCSTGALLVHSDQGSVYTSYAWLDRLLRRDGVRVSYSERGCKDNPWIESLWGRLKTEEGSRIAEADTFAELEQTVKERFTYYNTRRRHSSIEYQTPLGYLQTNGEDTALAISLN